MAEIKSLQNIIKVATNARRQLTNYNKAMEDRKPKQAAVIEVGDTLLKSVSGVWRAIK